MMFFSVFDGHDLGFLGKILIFLGNINCQDFGKKSNILARNEKNSRSWQEIQNYPRSWQENQDAKHWVTFSRYIVPKMERVVQLNDK